MKTLRTLFLLFSFAFVGFAVFLLPPQKEYHRERFEEKEREANRDNDWFMAQRSFPHDEIPDNALETAKQQMKQRFASSKTAGLWTLVGPSNIGGRITSLLIHPDNPDVIYAGSASGGVWRTTDNGASWENIFNEHFSIGALAFDETNQDILYVGTGEANPAGVATYPGNGLWKTTNAGATWTNIGLTQTGHIGKILINPNNENELYVAALGRYRKKTQERGVFKTTDGGNSWNKILFLNDTTGATDIIMDPLNSNHLIAAMWTRYRTPRYSIVAGISGGLFSTTNGGSSWKRDTSGFPHNDENLGRISLTYAPSNTSIIYALVANFVNAGGAYKSTNNGNSWTQTFDGSGLGESQVWYNNIIVVHPNNPNLVWIGMTSMYKSTNGGISFDDALPWTVHVDHHAMAYAPSDASRIVLGNDGGIFTCDDGGATWTKSYNLPITQFYAGTIDAQYPTHLFGGTQDNGTNRTHTGAHDSWFEFYGGDGFYCLVDPTDSNYIYAEYQNGGLGYSTDGGNTFNDGTDSNIVDDRTNWSTPFAMDLQHPKTLYAGTYRIYRTKNNMQSWTQISNDLTYGNGGRVGTISTIDVSQTDSNVLYVGTDDGRVWMTKTGGANWIAIDDSLPNRWVTRVAIDPDSSHIAYVTLSGFNVYDFGSHIYRTTNFGASWKNIAGNLPDIPINDIVIDPQYNNHLYIATDLNVMFTTNLGETWQIPGENFPDVSVHDLAIHSATRTLVAFTHGRSALAFHLVTGVREEISGMPQKFSLEQNYQNPFNPQTTIRFSLQATGNVTLKFYDILGKEVATLMNNETMQAGKHSVLFSGDKLPGGIYFYRLTAGTFSETKKMVLMK